MPLASAKPANKIQGTVLFSTGEEAAVRVLSICGVTHIPNNGSDEPSKTAPAHGEETICANQAASPEANNAIAIPIPAEIPP